MARNHIHFTTRLPTDQPVSGMRSDCQAGGPSLVREDGVVFWTLKRLGRGQGARGPGSEFWQEKAKELLVALYLACSLAC